MKKVSIQVTWIDAGGQRHEADERTAIVKFGSNTLFVCTGKTPDEAIERAKAQAMELAQMLTLIEVE
jgi:hypothetical protein